MQIAVVGAGYVGLVTALSIVRLGHVVILIEMDPDRLAMLRNGQAPFHEPDLDEALVWSLRDGRLVLASSEQAADHYRRSDATVICVGTPPMSDGQQDLGAINRATHVWAEATSGGGLLVVKSTVVPGTCDRLADRYPDATVVHMPEFLAEGNALHGACNPSRVVVGIRGGMMDRAHQPAINAISAHRPGVDVLEMELRSAELSKYASNFMLAARLSAINEVARLCDVTGADIDDVAEAVGADPRIGHKYLRSGIGWGGSCFPKDLTALALIAESAGIPAHMVNATIDANYMSRAWPLHMLDECLEADMRVAVWGVAFKPGTSDTRNAPALDVLAYLQELEDRGGVDWVRVHDPEARLGEQVAKPLMAVEGADVLVICTEWPVYCDMDPRQVARYMRGKVILDGRGIWNRAEVRDAGLDYRSPGRR